MSVRLRMSRWWDHQGRRAPLVRVLCHVCRRPQAFR